MENVNNETCENCGRVIGKLETPMVWHEKVVCTDCFGRLSGMRTIPPMPDAGINATLPLHAPAGRSPLRLVFLFLFVVLGTVTLGLFLSLPSVHFFGTSVPPSGVEGTAQFTQAGNVLGAIKGEVISLYPRVIPGASVASVNRWGWKSRLSEDVDTLKQDDSEQNPVGAVLAKIKQDKLKIAIWKARKLQGWHSENFKKLAKKWGDEVDALYSPYMCTSAKGEFSEGKFRMGGVKPGRYYLYLCVFGTPLFTGNTEMTWCVPVTVEKGRFSHVKITSENCFTADKLPS